MNFHAVKLASIFLLVLMSSITVAAQEGQSGMIKTADGYLIVANRPNGDYFTVEIKGSKIQALDEPMMFNLDGRFFQIQTAQKAEFLKNPSDKTLTDKAILEAHRKWESDYIAGVLKTELKLESEWIKLPDGRDVLAWGYEMPKVAAGQTAKKQVYLTVVKGAQVFLVNSAITDLADARDTRLLLFNTLVSMKPSEKPIDLLKLAEEIKNGKKP